MKGYKAFNKGFICKDFQYEEGQTYEHKGNIAICNSGFHFCENPLDVLNYYDLCESEFAEVEALGEIDTEKNKSATSKIKIGVRLGLPAFIKACFDFLWERTFPREEIGINSGDYSKLAASGHYSQLAASGDYSQLAASGYSSQLEITGEHSVGAAIGHENKIKGKIGSWITLAEWKYNNKLNKYIPVCVKSAQIDGEVLKEYTWYMLSDGEFKVVD